MTPGVDGCVRTDRQHGIAAFTPQLGGFNANEFALKKAILGDTRAGCRAKAPLQSLGCLSDGCWRIRC